jgi:hypothetical protein
MDRGIDMSEQSAMPITRKYWRKYWLFGLFAIEYIVEDRRPDLTYEQAMERLGYKYKHLIYVRFAWIKHSWVIHSKNECDDQPFRSSKRI